MTNIVLSSDKRIYLYNYYQSLDTEQFHVASPQFFMMPYFNQFLLASPYLWSVFIDLFFILLFPDYYKNMYKNSTYFWVWFLSLSIMHLWFSHATVRINSWSFCVTEEYSTVWMFHNLFIHLPVEGFMAVSSFVLLYLQFRFFIFNFLLLNNLDSQKSCKDITELQHIFYSPSLT